MVVQEESQENISVAMSDLIPVQDNDPVAARLRMSGECQLLWAILEDAMECYIHYVNNPSENAQQQFREAEEWIDSDEEEWLCSFISICRAFQIEPDYLVGASLFLAWIGPCGRVGGIVVSAFPPA